MNTKIIHQIWLGDQEMPSCYRRFAQTWRHYHPDWEYRLWGDQDLDLIDERHAKLRERLIELRCWSGLSNLLRYHLIDRFGGFYLDMDFECLSNVEPLLRDYEMVWSSECDPWISNAWIAADPGHPFMRSILGQLPETIPDANSPKWLGPQYVTGLADALNRWAAPSLTAVAALAQQDAAFAMRFRERFLERRHQRLVSVVAAACSPEQDAIQIAELIAASMWYRLMLSGQALDAAWVDSMVALVQDPRP